MPASANVLAEDEEAPPLGPPLQSAWYHRHRFPRCTSCDRVMYARITCASHVSEADCTVPLMLTCQTCRRTAA